MELDDLKHKIKKELEQPSANLEKLAFEKALHTPTKSILGKIKKSMILEFILNIICIVGFAYFAYTTEYKGLAIYLWTFVVVGLVFLFILRKLYQQLLDVEQTTGSILKTRLEQLYMLLRKFVKHYFQITMALIPICLIYSFALGYYDEQYQPSTNSTTGNSVEPYIVIAIILAYITGFTLFIYYFTKWYLRKLYGKHLDNLKNLLDELNEN